MLTMIVTVAVLAQPAPDRPATPADALVSPERVKGYVLDLEAFGTRHTLSDTQSATRGIGAARRWIKATMESFSPGLKVELESFEAPPSVRLPSGATVVNVVATLPGADPACADRAYYVVGHYDSRNAEAMDASADAPGANDDASGTAVVMECARVLTSLPPEHRPRSTIVFLCTAGEEQGLIGAKYHADNVASNKPYRVLGVLSNDIVGDPVRPEGREVVRVFSEGIPRNPGAEQLASIRAVSAESDSPSRQLARFVADVGTIEASPVSARLVFRPDRFLRGGDHSAFNEAGISAVRFTTPFEDYSRQHVNVEQRDGAAYGDVSAFVDADYLAGVARLNVATLVHLANAPRPPSNVRIVTARLETHTTLRWDPSPEPFAAGYEVLWRDTTEPTWKHVHDARTATEVSLPVQKDDYLFAVRAYGSDGWRSPVEFARAAPK